MKLTAQLKSQIIEYLSSLPNMLTGTGQRVLLDITSLDSQLISQINFDLPSAQFFPSLLSTFLSYGTLHDGRDPLEALLEASKELVGADKRAQCDLLIQQWRKARKDELTPGHSTGSQQSASSPPKSVRLKQQARKLERNEAYEEAIAMWQEIRDMDGDNTEADQEIIHLRHRIEERDSLQKIQQQLVRRMTDIKGIYMEVARRLKRMQKEGIDDEGEILLEVVRQFLNNALSAEEFADMWRKATTQTPPKQAEPNYEALTRRLIRGEIIVVIGPELHYRTGLPLPSLPDLVHTLAHDARYDDFAGSLSMISQYYQMTEYGRSTLVQTVQEAIEPYSFPKPQPLYEILASIGTPLLVVSVCYDRLLEQHFINKQKPFTVISHVKLDQQLSKVVLSYSDSDEVKIYDIAESLSPLKLMENGYSVIYKICGCFGLLPSSPEGAMDSLMISEEDYFAFAKRFEQIIPNYLATQIGRHSLLFLGNSLDDWQYRLILNAILEKNRTNRERSYAVQETPSPYESAYWKFHGVDLYPMNLKTFIDKLGDFV